MSKLQFIATRFFPVTFSELESGVRRDIPLFIYLSQTDHLVMRYRNGQEIDIEELLSYRKMGMKAFWSPNEHLEKWESNLEEFVRNGGVLPPPEPGLSRPARPRPDAAQSGSDPETGDAARKTAGQESSDEAVKSGDGGSGADATATAAGDATAVATAPDAAVAENSEKNTATDSASDPGKKAEAAEAAEEMASKSGGTDSPGTHPDDSSNKQAGKKAAKEKEPDSASEAVEGKKADPGKEGEISEGGRRRRNRFSGDDDDKQDEKSAKKADGDRSHEADGQPWSDGDRAKRKGKMSQRESDRRIPGMDEEAASDHARSEESATAIDALLAPGIEDAQRKEALRKISEKMLSKLSDAGDDKEKEKEAIKACQDFAEDVVEALIKQGAVDSVLSELLAISETEVVHSGTVSGFSVIFAMSAEHADQEFLGEIALGGLLHDVGLTLLPPDLLRVPENALTPKERIRYSQHIEFGLEILDRNHVQVSPNVRRILEQHHERYDGTGMPKKLLGKQLTEAAQIVAMGDLLDDLLSGRMDGKKRNPPEAIEALWRLRDGFKPELVEAVFRAIEKGKMDSERSGRIWEGIRQKEARILGGPG